MQGSRHLELGIDQHLTGGLVVPAAVVDPHLSRGVVDAPLPVAEVRRRNGPGGLHEHTFPLFHVDGGGTEHLRGRQVIALAQDGGGDGIATHTDNLRQVEVLINHTGQADEVTNGNGNFRVEPVDAAVCALSLLYAEQAAVDARHDATDGHQGIREHRGLEGLALLNGGDGNGPVHHVAAVIVDDGVSVVIVGSGVGAAELLEIVGVARLDAVSESAVDGTGDPVGVAQHGALLRVTVISHVVHGVVARAVVDGELTEVVGCAGNGTGHLTQYTFVFFEVGVGRGKDGRSRERIAAVEDGRRGGGQLCTSIEAAHSSRDDHTVTEGHLGSTAVEQSATDIDEDAAPGTRSILDGRIAAIDPGHDAPHVDHLTVVCAVVRCPHVLLYGADGDFGRVSAAAVIDTRIRIVIGGLGIGAARCGRHRAGDACIDMGTVSFEAVVEGVVVFEDDPLTGQTVSRTGRPITSVSDGDVRIPAQSVVGGGRRNSGDVPA